MAKFTFNMPDIGEGIAEAEIVQWHKQVGDQISEDEEFVDMMGTNTRGFVGNEKKGAHTRWCMNPYVFDNTYF